MAFTTAFIITLQGWSLFFSGRGLLFIRSRIISSRSASSSPRFRASFKSRLYCDVKLKSNIVEIGYHFFIIFEGAAVDGFATTSFFNGCDCGGIGLRFFSFNRYYAANHHDGFLDVAKHIGVFY